MLIFYLSIGAAIGWIVGMACANSKRSDGSLHPLGQMFIATVMLGVFVEAILQTS